ncbi:MAG: hypothetical protein IJM56_04035, partial [Clostridia bacterium]|nr:hypothetical protein [Clostridia bacterium]
MDDKSAFRARLQRRKLSPTAEAAMRNALFSLPEWQRAKRVFIYVSVDPEPDTHRIIECAL